MAEPREFRIRVCKRYFNIARYIAKCNKSYIEVGTEEQALAWKTKATANKYLKLVLSSYPSAEIEIHYLNEE